MFLSYTFKLNSLFNVFESFFFLNLSINTFHNFTILYHKYLIKMSHIMHIYFTQFTKFDFNHGYELLY